MNLERNYKQFLLILVFISVSLDAHCQKWNLKVDKDGIKIYTRAIAGSDVEEFRGEISVKTNLSGVLTAIDSVSEYPKWMYKCFYAERIKRVDQSSGYIYSVIDSPWPLSDRDLCTFYTVKQDTLTRIVTITMIGKKDYIPEKPDKVRIPAMKGFWQLIPVAKGVTKIVYQVHCESGGIVPAAVVNAYITDTPYYNLLNLRKIVESPLFPKIIMKNVKEL